MILAAVGGCGGGGGGDSVGVAGKRTGEREKPLNSVQLGGQQQKAKASRAARVINCFLSRFPGVSLFISFANDPIVFLSFFSFFLSFFLFRDRDG